MLPGTYLSYLNLSDSVYRYWLARPAVVRIPIDVRANEEWFSFFIALAHMRPYCWDARSRWTKILPSGKVKNIMPSRREFICRKCEWNTVFLFDCQSWFDKFSSHSLNFAYIWNIDDNDSCYAHIECKYGMKAGIQTVLTFLGMVLNIYILT